MGAGRTCGACGGVAGVERETYFLMRQIRLGDVQHHRCAQCDRAFRTWTGSFWLVQLGLLAATAALLVGAISSGRGYAIAALAVVCLALVLVMAKRWKTARDNPILPR